MYISSYIGVCAPILFSFLINYRSNVHKEAVEIELYTLIA